MRYATFENMSVQEALTIISDLVLVTRSVACGTLSKNRGFADVSCGVTFNPLLVNHPSQGTVIFTVSLDVCS